MTSKIRTVVIFGHNRVGKTTLANTLKRNLDYAKIPCIVASLATPLKEMAAKQLYYGLIPFPKDYCGPSTPYNSAPGNKQPYQYNCWQDLVKVLNGVLANPDVKESLRPILLELGTKQRNSLGPDYYASLLASTYLLDVPGRPGPLVIVDDARFVSEYDYFSKLEGVYKIAFEKDQVLALEKELYTKLNGDRRAFDCLVNGDMLTNRDYYRLALKVILNRIKNGH